ncbi:MAG: glycosyltransferase [Erysipelotrichaceae bacterium]|jgi:glycosyltransferase involved in cell wall biosynthesis|nr:glycosyltransferase [Erysipelotrichaceae bacterium]
MNKQPFFSFIIPSYNSALVLKNAVASVLKQSFESFEVIIINDGSTDETETYLKTLQDARIRFFTITNSGPNFARHYGIMEAKGQYLGFIDADDDIKDDLLIVAHDHIVKHNLDLFMFEYTSVDKNHRKIRQNQNPFNADRLFSPSDYQDFVKMCITSGHFNPLWKKLIRRELLDQYPLVDRDIRFGEDQLVSLSLIPSVQRALYLNESYYYYYRGPSSLSNTQTTSAFKALKMIDERIQTLYQLVKADRETERAIKKQHLVYVFLILVGLGHNKKISFKEFKRCLTEYLETNYYHFNLSEVQNHSSSLNSRQKKLLTTLFRKRYLRLYFLIKFFWFLKRFKKK